ncbi:glycine-rich family protein [Salix suchowensis]|nr:glycine-rich family protein [Salix suchowensis]
MCKACAAPSRASSQCNVVLLRGLAPERNVLLSKIKILDDDYSKLSFLCANRSVCLHSKYGKHYTCKLQANHFLDMLMLFCFLTSLRGEFYVVLKGTKIEGHVDSWVVPNVLVNKLLMAWTGVPWEIIEGKQNGKGSGDEHSNGNRKVKNKPRRILRNLIHYTKLSRIQRGRGDKETRVSQEEGNPIITAEVSWIRVQRQ